MRTIMIAFGLALLACHNLALAQDSSSSASAAAAQGKSNPQTDQIDSLFSAPFGPLSVSAGPATQGGFGVSVSGTKSTGPLARLYSNLPSVPGPDAWHQSYFASLIYKVNGLWTTRAQTPNNASISLEPGIDEGLYYGHFRPPSKACKPKKLEDGSYQYCKSTLPAAIGGFGLHAEAEYRYGTVEQSGRLSNVNQALFGASAYAAPIYLREKPWLVVVPMLTVSYYKPVTTSTSLITLPSSIKSDYFQTEFHVELGSDFFGKMAKINDQYPLLLDVKYDGSRPLSGADRGWQSLWRVQLAFSLSGSSVKPAITYQNGSQGGFKFDREVIVGFVAQLLDSTY